MLLDLLSAVLLGVIEGLLEFLPVSSTGHLILAKDLMDVDPERFGASFVILIQLGAILAVLSLYFGRLWQVAMALPSSQEARRFVTGVLIAFLPAVVVGLLLGDYIQEVLFSSLVVCISLLLGGIVLLLVDRSALVAKATQNDAMAFSLLMYLKIGMCQCLALIPGVSRSGATIVGAMLLGADKRAAAEFSFFLALPTMGGAFVYQVLKSYKDLSFDGITLIMVGFIAAFLSALLVVRSLLNYVSKRGFAVFGWWRIIVGGAGLIALTVLGHI